MPVREGWCAAFSIPARSRSVNSHLFLYTTSTVRGQRLPEHHVPTGRRREVDTLFPVYVRVMKGGR